MASTRIHETINKIQIQQCCNNNFTSILLDSCASLICFGLRYRCISKRIISSIEEVKQTNKQKKSASLDHVYCITFANKKKKFPYVQRFQLHMTVFKIHGESSMIYIFLFQTVEKPNFVLLFVCFLFIQTNQHGKQVRVLPQQATSFLSLFADLLRVVIKEERKKLNVLSCLPNSDLHVPLPHNCILQQIPWFCVEVCCFRSILLRHFFGSLLNSLAIKRFEFHQRLLSICLAPSRWTVLTFCSVTGKYHQTVKKIKMNK